MKILICALAALLATSAVSYAQGNMMSSSQSITVNMKAQNGSGENGTATLTQMPKGVKVTLDVKGAPTSAQPTHIHAGTCSKLNPAPAYPLNPLANGKSTTMLSGKKLSDLSGGKFAINVHKSTNDLATYVSCGDIK